MSVDPATAKHSAEHAGETYYFCCNGCKTKFAADPEKYLKPREPEPVIEGAIYTCPMHPEIRQEGPGTCPICGMALEPEVMTADTAPNPELADMSRRFWIGLALSIPVMAIEWSGMLLGRALADAGASELHPVRLRHAGGAVGGLAVLRARLAVAASRATSTCSR